MEELAATFHCSFFHSFLLFSCLIHSSFPLSLFMTFPLIVFCLHIVAGSHSGHLTNLSTCQTVRNTVMFVCKHLRTGKDFDGKAYN